MALTLQNTLPAVFFTRNPRSLTVATDNRYTTQPVLAEFELKISGPAINLDGISILAGPLAFGFTAKDTPNYNANEYQTGDDAYHQAELFYHQALKAVDGLTDLYTITLHNFGATDARIKLVAKSAGPEFNISITNNTTASYSGQGFVAGVKGVERPDYLLLANLMVNNQKAAQLSASPKASNTVSFRVDEILDAYGTFTPPAANNREPQLAPLIHRLDAYFGEHFGNPPVTVMAPLLQGRWFISGGPLREQDATFDTDLFFGPTRGFITPYAGAQFTGEGAQNMLSGLIHSATQTIDYSVKVHKVVNDVLVRNESTYTATFDMPMQNPGIALFPLSMTALDNFVLENIEDLWGMTIEIKQKNGLGGTILTFPPVELIFDTFSENTEWVLYLNRYGVPETMRFTGQKNIGAAFTRNTFQRIEGLNQGAAIGSFNLTEQDTITLFTGHLSLGELEKLRDIKNSRQVWWLEDGQWVPVVVEGTQEERYHNKQDLYAGQLSFSKAYINKG